MPTGPKGQEGCSGTTYQLTKKLIKIVAEVVSHGRYVAFQMRRSLSRGNSSPTSCG